MVLPATSSEGGAAACAFAAGPERLAPDLVARARPIVWALVEERGHREPRDAR